MVGVYIHIPFCVRKCGYCDFLSFELDSFRRGEHFCEQKGSPPLKLPLQKGIDFFSRYGERLLGEIGTFRKDVIFFAGVDTVYVGGGTPTALPSFVLCEILRTALRELPVVSGAEVTVEVNPGTVDFEYLVALRECGVTRISFGLQATQDFLLRELGREHTRSDFVENFRAARWAGFDNINVDLMFALHKQTQEDWRETLREIVTLSPEHISAYSLTPAENTPLFDGIERGEIVLPGDKIDRAMYHEARSFLAKSGYAHYEISNFAMPGFESRHNINCWTLKPYIGFGLGAYSFDGKSRWHNTEDMGEYLAGQVCHDGRVESRKNLVNLSCEDLLCEKIILGLRLAEGVVESEFSGVFANEIAKLKKDGLLESRHNRLCLTPHGLDFANRVFVEFVVS